MINERTQILRVFSLFGRLSATRYRDDARKVLSMNFASEIKNTLLLVLDALSLGVTDGRDRTRFRFARYANLRRRTRALIYARIRKRASAHRTYDTIAKSNASRSPSRVPSLTPSPSSLSLPLSLSSLLSSSISLSRTLSARLVCVSRGRAFSTFGRGEMAIRLAARSRLSPLVS